MPLTLKSALWSVLLWACTSREDVQTQTCTADLRWSQIYAQCLSKSPCCLNLIPSERIVLLGKGVTSSPSGQHIELHPCGALCVETSLPERAEIQINEDGEQWFVVIAEDRARAELFFPNTTQSALLDSVKGGYRSEDGRFLVQYDGTQWHLWEIKKGG